MRPRPQASRREDVQKRPRAQTRPAEVSTRHPCTPNSTQGDNPRRRVQQIEKWAREDKGRTNPLATCIHFVVFCPRSRNTPVEKSAELYDTILGHDKELQKSRCASQRIFGCVRALHFTKMHNPKLIGQRFEILSEIKKGGMGVVYKALDRENNQLVAIKKVRVADRQLIQSIRREVFALVRIRHPGVIAIVAEGLEDGMPWYGMEFIEAETLQDYCLAHTASRLSIKGPIVAAEPQAYTAATSVTNVTAATGKPGGMRPWTAPNGQTSVGDGTSTHILSAADLLVILTQVRRLCIPLSYIHGEGLIHLDLKPDNVLIRASGMPVILDFGLATILRSQFSRDALAEALPGAGTILYMAPEQIKGELVDARTDLYSLGCILYELLTGRVPFPGHSAAETAFGHINLKPARPSTFVGGLPPELDELVLRMLAKEPRERIGYAADVDRALERIGASGWDGSLPSARGYVYRPRLAGRHAELDKIRKVFDAAAQGESRILLLGGESGVGKTRLVSEFARIAEAAVANTQVYIGECRPQGGPLHAFRRILQGIADHCRVANKEECRRILGERAATLARYLPDFQWFVEEDAKQTPDLLPDAARQLLFQDFLSVLHALSRNHPNVIILDDIQWADELSLGFLDYILAQAEITPLRSVILATYRAEEMNPFIERLATCAKVTSISLGRLDMDAVGILLADMLALTKASSDVIEGLFRHSEGNPLFLTEYLLESVAAELIWRDADGVWHAQGDRDNEINYARLPLPATVKDLIAFRLAGLSHEARRLAQFSAVLGAEPNLEVLYMGYMDSLSSDLREERAVAGEVPGPGPVARDGTAPPGKERAATLQESAFFRGLDELRRRHILDEKAPTTIGFTHSKVREAIYAQLENTARAALHLHAAKTLAAFLPTHPAHVGSAIAEHYYAGGDDAAALPHALNAGDEARALYGHDEAERFYLRALKTLERMDDPELSTKTLMKLGLVHMAAFDSDKAKRVYDEAFRQWQSVPSLPAKSVRTAELSVAAGEPMSLDPGRTYDTDSAFVQRQLFTGLVEVDEEANVLPALAYRWQVSQDGRTYTFFLRPDLRWSDGRPLLAKHFEDAWKRNLSPTLKSEAAALLDVVYNARAYRLGRVPAQELGVLAKGPHELEVRLAAPIGYFLYLLAHPIAAPLPTWLLEAKGNAWSAPGCIVTNGPFKVGKWLHGQLIELEHNSYDVIRSTGNIRSLKCKLYHDYRVALRAYQSGELDMLDMVSADAQLVAELRSEHADELVSVPIQSTSYLVFRADRPPFDDVRVRRAFAHAIDRSRLAAAAQKISAQPATGGFVPPGVPGHSPNLMLGFHPEQARALLAAAQCSEQDLAQITWLYTHGIVDPALVAVLRDSWQRVLGIDIKPHILRWQEYQQRVETGVPDMLITTWTADFFDPDNFLRTVFHSVTGLNEPKWNNMEFNLLVDNAASRRDQAGRLNFYRAADRILVVDEASAVPLCYGREPVLVKPWVQSFPHTASWLRHLKNCRVQKNNRGQG